MARIGFGYDVHRLVQGRKLVLGGVEIAHDAGLDGHSDADVLLHAVMDALLGASGLGDIGKHFPDTDPRYRGISSVLLLRHVGELLAQHRLAVGNIDATVVLERPRIADAVPAMRRVIADTLRMDEQRVSIKATSNEGLGFAGRSEGAAAHAVAMLVEPEVPPPWKS
ncbi:MAG: 2-C-methyl-D-erythritol 2,4-cyclodiphosphate synthase [Bacteroidota bacterium]